MCDTTTILRWLAHEKMHLTRNLENEENESWQI